MQRRSLLESYTLLVYFLLLVCFLVALYYLGYGIVAREAPEYTISNWTYGSHQTNDRYWKYVSFGDRRPRPPEEALTAERERSWRAEQQLERRNGTRIVWLSSYGAVAAAVVFWVHWRLARRATCEQRGVGSARIHRPLALASVFAVGLSCSFCSGLVGGLAVSAHGGFRSQFEEESRAIAPILAGPAFAEVEIRERSDGHVELSGVVPTEADLKRLREQVAQTLGERRGEEATRGVQVRLVVGPSR